MQTSELVIRKRVSRGLALMVLAPAATARLSQKQTPRHRSTPRQHSTSARRRHGSVRLRPRSFTSCTALVRYARHGLSLSHGRREPPVTPYGGPPSVSTPVPPGVAPGSAGSGAAGGSTSYSTTNVQEPGVDEPDIVKTDGSTIWVASGDVIYAVDVSTGAPRNACGSY